MVIFAHFYMYFSVFGVKYKNFELFLFWFDFSNINQIIISFWFNSTWHFLSFWGESCWIKCLNSFCLHLVLQSESPLFEFFDSFQETLFQGALCPKKKPKAQFAQTYVLGFSRIVYFCEKLKCLISLLGLKIETWNVLIR